MQRPRMIATAPYLAAADASIKSDPAARAEFLSLKARTETIFDMRLLSYDPPHSALSQLAGQIAAESIQMALTAAPAALPYPMPTPEATPLDFLPSVDSFAPKPLVQHGVMFPEAMGFEPKGYSANEIAKAGLSRLQALALVWRLWPETKFAERAIAEMKALCALPHWGDQFLATATILQALAIGYDWMHEDLDDATRALVANAMLEKGIGPALAQFDATPQPNWIRLSNNWNIVGNASLIMAALALEPDWPDPRIEKAKQAALASIKTGLTLLHDDGSWRLEGPGYWHLATEHLTYLLAALDTAEPALLTSVETPGIKQTGRYRCYMSGPSNLLFNFGDSPEQRPGLWWLRWIGRRYGLAHCHELAEDRTGATGASPQVHPMDVLWRRSSADPVATPLAGLPVTAVFCETAVMRGPWGSPHGVYVGIKGGETSGRRSHSHLDLGHFVYEIAGHRWAIDLEPDDYTDCYLTPPERYKFYRANSFGHNTLMINQQQQRFEPALDLPPVTATFSQASEGADGTSIAVDLSAAYPAMRSVRRTFTLAPTGALAIADEISSTTPIEKIAWSLHTRANVTCAGSRAELHMPAAGTTPAAVLVATLEGVDGAVFSAAPARAPTLYSACNMTEAVAKGVTSLMINLENAATDVRLVVRLALAP